MPKPIDGPLRFKQFPWQKEILNCTEPQVSIMKAAQMGFSVVGMIKALFSVSQKKEDVLYVLPTANIASDFAKARLDAIVDLSPELRDMWAESNVGLKTTHDHAHIYIRGSVSERNLVSMPIGTAIIDEFDRCAASSMVLVKKRLSGHEKKHLFALSTPTLPEFGISEEYNQGTQEHFIFKCPACSRSTELVWPDCIERCGDCATDDRCHESYYKCKECQAKLDHCGKSEWLATGRWEPTHKAHGHRSFWIPQLYGTAMTAGEIVIDSFRAESDEAANIEFHNQVLGQPYLMEGGRVTEELVKSCIYNHKKSDERPRNASRMIVMGIDVGTFLDIVISEYIYPSDPGNEPHLHSIEKVLWEGRIPGSDFDILDQLMGEWQVQHACIDHQPETNLAKAFARRFHKFVSLVQYRRGTVGNEIKINYDDNRVPTLTIDRTSFFDMSLGRFHSKKIQLPQDISGVFKEHVQSPIRTYELDEMGRPRAIYVSNKADHLAHALLLCEAAHFRAFSYSTGRAIKAGESYFNF
jgi:hypothetical protein